MSYSKTLPWNQMIQELRKYNGYTQQQVADAVNISRKTYVNYEAGIAEIKVETIKKLAVLYGIPSSVILGESYLMETFMEEITNDKF